MKFYKFVLKLLYKRRAPLWTFKLVARLALITLVLLVILSLVLIPIRPALATEWWQSVPGKTPIIAYKAFGVGNQAASYINLANPGTYDAWPAKAPTWNSDDGWIFNGLSQYLDTGAEPESDWTILVRFTNVSNGDRQPNLFGVYYWK